MAAEPYPGVLETPLRIASLLCTSLVVLSFTLFAVGELRSASNATQAEVAGEATVAPDRAAEREREREANPVREAIDDANDVLLAPFAALGDQQDSVWVRRGLPALLGIVLYGFLLSALARFGHGRATSRSSPGRA